MKWSSTFHTSRLHRRRCNRCRSARNATAAAGCARHIRTGPGRDRAPATAAVPARPAPAAIRPTSYLRRWHRLALSRMARARANWWLTGAGTEILINGYRCPKATTWPAWRTPGSTSPNCRKPSTKRRNGKPRPRPCSWSPRSAARRCLRASAS